MNTLPLFNKSNSLTMGVELELQLIDLQTFNLAMKTEDFLNQLSTISLPGELKPEITSSMIEFNSSIHHSHESLLLELHNMRNIICFPCSDVFRLHIYHGDFTYLPRIYHVFSTLPRVYHVIYLFNVFTTYLHAVNN